MGGEVVYWFYRLLWLGLDWTFPPYCAGCGAKGYRWCPMCQQSVLSQPMICKRCHLRKSVLCAGICQKCTFGSTVFSGISSVSSFEGPLRNAIHRLKYKKDIGLGDELTLLLENIIKQEKWDIDLVVPVPLSRSRLNERGYNQAALLGIPLALKLGVPYQAKAVHRWRETKSQVHLTKQERYSNVEGAFEADQRLIQQKSVLIIDDVITTGATMISCGKAVKDKTAKRIYGLSLAQAKFALKNEYSKNIF